MNEKQFKSISLKDVKKPSVSKKDKKLIKTNLKEKLIKKIRKTNTDGLENLDFWYDTIRRDRWWDSNFMLLIWEKKLESMISYWDKSHYVDWEEDHKNMKRARKLMKKLRKDRFLTKYYNMLSKKYGEEVWCIDNDEENEDFTADFRVYMGIAQTEKKLIEDELFDLLKDNWEKWWD